MAIVGHRFGIIALVSLLLIAGLAFAHAAEPEGEKGATPPPPPGAPRR